jgi:hypothetical protein
MVRADATQVAAFRRATLDVAATDDFGVLPFTFPIRWLARPEIRAAVARLVRGEDSAALLPLHESQVFDYATPLLADVDYCMSVDICREAEPARLVLRAEVGPEANIVHLHMEMVLRIVAVGDTQPESGERAGL